jgi:hypothetical protein
MELIEETIINKCQVKYFKGFDLPKILNHPKDGSEGLMVVLFNSIKQEELKYTRHELILHLLESKKIEKFSDILDNIDNSYLTLYETHGYTDIIYKSLKYKLEVIRDYHFAASEILWRIN